MIVIKFSSTWCMPCKVVKPIFEKISKDETYKDVKFIEVDVDGEENVPVLNSHPNDLCIRYMVRNIPTIIALDENMNEIGRIVGTTTEDNMRQFIDEKINGAK